MRRCWPWRSRIEYGIKLLPAVYINMETLITAYLAELGKRDPRAGDPELEVRFGGARGFRRLAGADCDRVVQRLRSLGFTLRPSVHLLRVLPAKSARAPRGPRPRAEFQGLRDISLYCETNKLPTEGTGTSVRFETKSLLDPKLGNVDNHEFEFRTSLQVEKGLVASSRVVRELTKTWEVADKQYRYMSRATLESTEFPLRVDVSVVRSARGRGMTEAGLLSAPVSFEIEIEAAGDKVGVGTAYASPAQLHAALRRVCTYVLQGIQGTNYPVAKSVRSEVMTAYAGLVGARASPGRDLGSWAFAGPSSVTLQVDNITAVNPAATIANVRTDYTVTDKADGDRKLLYVHEDGRVFLINTNMQAQFAGATASPKLAGTLLDGEHIPLTKTGAHLNLYAAFDIYWQAGKSTRDLPFVAKDGSASRLDHLGRTVAAMALNGPRGDVDSASPMGLVTKAFEATSESRTIFECSQRILRRQKDGGFEYETDGLIFTPSDLAVGAMERGAPATRPKKSAWPASFKWKPPEQNTIDFLVVMKKTSDGAQDVVHNIFQAGVDTGAAQQLTQYKTAVLCVGGDTSRGGANPCQEMLEGRAAGDEVARRVAAGPGGRGGQDSYKPLRFFPTQPYDPEAGECNLLLTPGEGGAMVMRAESSEAIEDLSIVEFRYDPDREGPWRWVPLRVRHDKTAELRAGGKNYGNNERVANSNWRSLHNPVTEEMLATGAGIPDELANDDVYYNRSSRSNATRALRDFHNRYVKHALIVGASKPGGTIVDLAVGKAGDLPKWTDAKASFVLGVDISRDNVHNAKDGACARYLRYKASMPSVPGALFVQGDMSRNVREGVALGSAKARTLCAAVFGQGPKSKSRLGPMVFDHYGVGSKGFGTCSIQFALHYVWSGPRELQGFLRNVAETTAQDGYFIGTCFDGEKLFELLRAKKEGESVRYMDGDTKLWELTKRYDRDTYAPDASCLGYAVDVFQESINKTFREFLVNHVYLTRLLENYGFAPATPAEAEGMGLPRAAGSFEELFRKMEASLAAKPSLARRYGAAAKMGPRERDISFLNRYFVYKKVRSVDAREVMYGLLGEAMGGQAQAEQEAEQAGAVAAAKGAESAATPRRTGRKLKLRRA